MDKNTISGLVLIIAIIIGFTYFNRPSKEEVAAQKHRDSIQMAEAEKIRIAEQVAKELEIKEQQKDSVINEEEKKADNQSKYGVFAGAVEGEKQFTVLENNLFKVHISNLGGKVYSVELKNYKRHNGEPLILFEGDDNKFGLNFFAQKRSIQTNDLIFIPSTSEQLIKVSGPEIPKGKEGRESYNEDNPGESKSLSMKLDAGGKGYIEYVYSIKHNSYMIDFDIRTSGLQELMGQNTLMGLVWSIDVPRQERISKYGEDRYTNICYKYFEDEVDEMSPGKSATETLSTRVKWIGFKQLFFSSVLIAENFFPNAEISTVAFENDTNYLSKFNADIAVPVEAGSKSTIPLQFYFGPNQYNTLKQFDISLEEELDLGWTVIGWVNIYIVIPAFDFLRRYINNFGLIILLLTIYIKLLVSPFTYKSYKSQAKMRALKPDIEELQKKYGPDKKMEQQQATMALYKKAGVNPLGGCLPMVFQFPVLIAMFRFFPVSIELRQQSFLWADDLSSYDSIFNLPFEIPFYGDHVSLFCLLMTVTNIFYIKMNNEMNAASSQQMPGMKTMMYMMPVMFLFIFNNYSSGLSLYYFLSLLITFLQMYIFRRTTDEEAIRVQLKAKQKKPVKKSKFQKKLEEMTRQRGMDTSKKK